jgi:glyoxylate reductase
MNKKTILVTRKIPNISPLTSEVELEVFMGQERPPTREELLTGIKGVSAVISLLTEKMDSEVMDSAGKNLLIIANYAVGYDNIDLEEATKRGIIVTNTPGKVEAVAEHALALCLTLGKDIVSADKFVKEGKYEFWNPNIFLSPYFKTKTLGIIGAGRIGAHLAELGHSLFKEIIYYDVKENREIENRFGAKKVSLENLAIQSDFISIHTVLNDETKHMINVDFLSKMKKTAYIINTSRGGVIDESALIEALSEKTIAGAGLDVFENEPEIPEKLLSLDNVILTPHIASATDSSRAEMSDIAIENVMGVIFEGKIPASVVNTEVIGKSRVESLAKSANISSRTKLYTSLL